MNDCLMMWEWEREEGEILSWCVGETALGNIEKPLYLLGFKYPPVTVKWGNTVAINTILLIGR